MSHSLSYIRQIPTQVALYMWDKEQSRELEPRLAESGPATFPVSPSKSATGSGPELCFLKGTLMLFVSACGWLIILIVTSYHPCEPLRPVILLHDSPVELSNERQSWSITGLNGWQGLWVDDHSEKLLAPPRRLCFHVCLSICLCVYLLTTSLKN